MKDDKCGVYQIKNKVNGKVYIGSSKNIYERWKQHIKKLNKGNHDGEHFQNAWNLYGADNFEFTIIEECEPEIRFKREQYYMDLTKCYVREYGYNTNKKAYWQDCAAEVEAKLSASSKKNIGERGVHKYSEKQAKQAIEMLLNPDYRLDEIAEIVGASESFVKSILYHKTWKYLTEDVTFPKRDRGNRRFQFDEMQIQDIIRRLLSGESNANIAEKYGVPYQEIHGIRTYQTYKKWTNGIVFPQVHKGGENCGSTNLTNDDALKIIQLYNSGLSYSQISKKLNIDNSIISNIIRGQHWKDLSDQVKREPPGSSKGENNRHAKLTEDDVINILQLHKRGIPVRKIAEQYPIAECTIYNIIKGNTWKHINRDEIL